MRTIVITLLIAQLMYFNLNAQKVAYTGHKPKKTAYKSEKLNLAFFDSGEESFKAEAAPEGFGAALLPLVPTLFDLGVKITTNQLEKRKKKYSGDYIARNSKIQEDLIVPGAVVTRELDGEKVFTLELRPIRLEKREAFVFYISALDVKKSKAFASRKSKHLDYTIELTPILAGTDGKKIKQEISPITITGVELGKGLTINSNEYRSDLIPLSDGMELVELTVKIVESNPDVVKIEDVLSTINTYKEDTKTIINNFIDTEDKSDETAGKENPKENGQPASENVTAKTKI